MLLPVLLHWPQLSGWLSENPAWLLSGLSQGSGAGHGVLTGYPGWIDGNVGVTTQALGGLAARDWLSGVVPWWNPSSGVGLPLAAELQNQAFFLPFVLLLRLFDGVVYLRIVLQVVAGLACYGLLHELKLARLAALTGALCFELNGSFAWFGHGPIMPVAFLPLLLFGIERARRHRWQGACWIGAAIGWSLLAGFPETAYLDGLLGLAWALLRVCQGGRADLALAVVAGGLAGVLLAAPPLLAFAQSLPVSFIGNHVDFGSAALAPANRAALLFPYLFGPPMYGGFKLSGAASLHQFIFWFRQAAYLDLPLLALAAMALRRGAPDRGLRWLLAGWLVVALGRAMGVPGISAAVNLLPLLRNAVVQLYILPSCQMAVTVLAALAIDDWRRGRLPARWVGRCGAAVAVAALATLPGAWAAIGALRQVAWYPAYPVAQVLGSGGVVLGVVLLLARGPGRRTAPALGALLVGEAALLCFLPLLAGTPRPRAIDRAAIAYLAARPGDLRVNAVASLTPNYGAWFGIAAIDHNYLPVPQAWVDDVRATLLPGMDGVNNVSSATDPAALEALRARLPALAAHGVGYVLLPPEIDPFAATIAVKLGDVRAVALALDNAVAGSIAGRHVVAGRLNQVRVQIGTYRGAARGTLGVRLCQAPAPAAGQRVDDGGRGSGSPGIKCVSGQASVAKAADNAALVIPMAPLDVVAGQTLTYTMAMLPGSERPPALWLWQLADTDPAEAVRPGLAPRLTLHLAPPPASPLRVYADATVAIYRLADAAPFFDAPGCALSAPTFAAVQADCPRPTRMLRRELAYPGWRARQDGHAASIAPDGIYQSVLLPQGVSHWRFDYAPPGVVYAWLASALGGLALLAFAWKGRPGKVIV